MPNVVVIGAGVIGSACALRLAQAGLRVTVVERAAPGSEASQAALGVLQFHAKPNVPDAYQYLALRSRELYPDLLDELAGAGHAIAYRAGGQLTVALAEDDWPALEESLAANAALGLPVERLTAEECRLLEGNLAPGVLGGVFYTEDAWVDNTALTLALIEAAQQAGAELRRASAEAVECQAGRATGVRCGPDSLSADWVVLAAGCWSGQVRGVPALPITPRRGQALALEGQPVRRVVSSARGYVVPRGADQVLVGATVEHAGFDRANTLGGLHELASIGLELVPRLRGSTYLGAWAGLRPGTPDGMPFIGPFAALPNVVAAAGHFRNGILHAPSTAELVCAIITGTPLPVDLTALAPDRAAPAAQPHG